MPSLFISYRRGDSPDTVKLIYERLKNRLPHWEVYYDHESIPLGQQFPEQLYAKVRAATAVLVVIGPKWLDMLKERKSVAVDHVREEVRLASESRASLVPVLVANATMPTDSDLAEFADLAPLLDCHVRLVRNDPEFENDLEPIADYLQYLEGGDAVGGIPADRYNVIDSLGRGGLGSIFKAVDRVVGRLVALKLHPPSFHEAPAHRAWLRKRLLESMRLNYPFLVKVFDVGEKDGILWEAQEFMEGGDLMQLLRDGPLPPHRAVELLAPIATALQYLHEHGYVHRNLKPRKILLTAGGTPKLADLDLAKRLDVEGAEEEPLASIIGTPRYMAPEQWQGNDAAIGPAADIYGFGAVLYETLTGRPPAEGAGLAEVAQLTMSAEPVPPSLLQPGVPSDLDTICLKCLEKDPSRRYATAMDLAKALGSFAQRAQTSSRASPSVACARTRIDLPPSPPTMLPGRTSPVAAKVPPASEIGIGRAVGGGIALGAALAVTTIIGGTVLGVCKLWEHLGAPLRRWLGVGTMVHDQVDATVFAQPAVRAGDKFLVQVFAHLPAQGEQAREMAREFDPQAERRGVTSLELQIAHGDRLTFHLTMVGLEIDRPQADFVWRGRAGSVQFDVCVPLDHTPGTVVGTVTASLESVPVGHVKFKLTVTQAASRANSTELIPVGESARRYQHAFISYASADRKEVLKRVQMLARLRIRFFQDVLNLDPGVRWQKELYRHIDESDLFLLFWSTPALESKWVLEEVRYALKRKGDKDMAPPEILPIVLEGPPPPPPPPELAHLHFNDYLLYLMQEPKVDQ